MYHLIMKDHGNTFLEEVVSLLYRNTHNNVGTRGHGWLVLSQFMDITTNWEGTQPC
jgi:hypothetical protein